MNRNKAETLSAPKASKVTDDVVRQAGKPHPSDNSG